MDDLVISLVHQVTHLPNEFLNERSLRDYHDTRKHQLHAGYFQGEDKTT